MKKYSIFISKFHAVFLLIVLSACHDYSILLPNGYKLVSVGGDARIIVNADSVVITDDKLDGTVDLYTVCGDIIVGKLVLYRKESLSIIKSNYFIVDTKSGMILKELSNIQLREKLAAIGIEKVKLRRPINTESISDMESGCSGFK
jgi:hypothetical protein